jgi:PAS domain S-box-containing protein
MYIPPKPELYGVFLEHIPVAIAMFDRQMRYLLATRRWLTDYGLGNQNIIGRSHYEVFPNLPDQWIELHQRCLMGTVERCDEDSFIRPDGTREWVRWEVHPWRHSSGEIGGLFMFAEFITPLENSELELTSITWEERTVEDSYARSEVSTFRDEEKTTTCLNLLDSYLGSYLEPSICWGSGSLAGKLEASCSNLCETNRRVPQAVFSGKGNEFDEFAARPSERSLEKEINKLLGCDSTTCADMAVALHELQREISDRKRTEEALRASESRFHKLAANMPGAIYQFLLRPNGSQTIVYISSGCRDLYELEPEVIQEDVERLWALIHPDDLPALQESILVSAETLRPWCREARIITPSGKLKWIQGASRPEKLEGGEILWDGLLLDITERKQAEEQLQQYKEHLEDVVHQRTAALTKVNEQLQQEIAQRQRVQEALLESQMRLTLLNSIATGMNSGMSVEQVIERTVRLVSECFKTLRVAYSILDDRGSSRVIHAIEPPGMPRLVGLAIDLSAAPDYLNALYRKKRVVVEDVARDDRLTPLTTAMLAGGIQARLDVPLQHSEQLVGLLCFDSPSPREWSEHEIATLTEIAEYLSIAIKKARTQQEGQQAQEALRKSEVRFQKLATNVPGIIYQYRLRSDGSHSFPYISPGCRELYERDPEEIQQNADLVIDQIHPDDRQKVECSIAVSAQTLQPWSCEWRIIMPSGQIKWVQGVSRAEKQVNGDILWDGVMIDISDRKLAEEARRLSEANFRRLAQREAIVNRLAERIRNSLDLKTIQQTLVDEIREWLQLDRCHIAWHRPLLAPPAWEVVTEAKAPYLSGHVGCYPSTEISPLAEKLQRLELIRLDSIETIGDPARRQLLLSLGYTSILALPTQTQTGEVIVLSCIHCRTSRQWTDDEVELLQAVMAQLAIAITHAELYQKTRTKAQQLEQALHELQNTQTQLVQSEKMSSLGQLVAGVAHEINNPVSFISGNVGHASDYIKDLLYLLELYRATYPDSTAEIQALAEEIDLDFLVKDLPKLLDSMKVGASRIQEIVGSLRSFSRIDQSERKPVNLHEDLDNTLLILKHRLKAKAGHPQIEVIKEYGNLPLVECYAGQINQVFMNLLTNAIDAIEEESERQASTDNTEESNFNPKIAIATRVVDSNRVSITIADNGSGIPPNVFGRLFDPFFTTKPIGKGTGLGLAISYQIIVEKHGGSLQYHSLVGQGTEFVIEIPLKQM